MNAASLKLLKHSYRANLQYAGLIVADIPATYKRSFFVGRVSEQIDNTSYTGETELFVHQGGLRDKRISASAKKMFREEVMPALAEYFSDIGRNYSGRIKLHFNEGILINLKLIH